MKKITLLAVAFVAISLASCKKARTCTCTDNNGDKTVTVTDKISKEDANLVCPKTYTGKYTSGSSTSNSSQTCVLS